MTPSMKAFFAADNDNQRKIKTTLGNAEALEHIVLSHLHGATPEHRPVETVSARPVRLSLGGMPFQGAHGIER